MATTPLERQGSIPWLGALGAVGTAAALFVTAGTRGLVAGIGIAALWYVIPAVYVVAVGHIALVVVFPGRIPPLELGLVEAGMIGILAGPSVREGEPIRGVAAVVAALAGLLAIAWFARGQFDAPWAVAVVLVGAVATIAYGFHRYERVRLDLVEGST